MKQSLHILHVEDSKEDSELIAEMLSENDIPCRVTRIETRPELFDELETNAYDLILADCRLPGFSGLHALEIAHALKPEIPFVFVSGTIGEETAIESLRNGATDYVLKDNLNRLPAAVRRALAEAEERMLCHQLQQRLREAGRLEAISTLSNGIAHDFNNILTIILGHASLLASEINRPGRVLEIGDTITEAARRGSEVVQQLLAFAQKSDGHKVLTDLNVYIQERLVFLREKVPARIEIDFTPSEKLPEVLVDASQLERILVNLIANSSDSIHQHGRIVISAQLISAPHTTHLLTGVTEGDHVCVKVADTGRGMDAATREHIFDPFYTTKERGRGTGLGLPVVYGLMQAQNGSVVVDSELGKGTIISLFFPVPPPRPAAATPLTQGLDPSLCGTETILVIEDEPDVSFFLETVFESHGYTVFSAGEHDAAMKLFEQHGDAIRLVFSDIGLPKVDGIAICSKLKKINPALAIILVSGYSPKEYEERLAELRNDDFIAKPYQTRDILTAARKVLNARKTANAA